MSFLGYLLKVNGTKIPMKYISHKSYSSTPNRIQDLDSYRDADGILRRNIVPHKASTIQFSTPYLHLADKKSLQALLPSRVKLTLEYWNDETNTYTSGVFYIPDVSYDIYSTTNEDIIYMPISYQFIEY